MGNKSCSKNDFYQAFPVDTLFWLLVFRIHPLFLLSWKFNSTIIIISTSALNAQAALSQVRERQLAAQTPEVNDGPSSSSSSTQASGSVPQPRPEHCEGAAAGGRTPLPPPAVPPPSAPVPTTPLPSARPPAPPQSSVFSPVLQDAEEAVLTKLRWATAQLQSSASLEASIQLCSLISSCANSLRSLKELSQ